jgi:L-lactate dehydrogenase complex protein LldF
VKIPLPDLLRKLREQSFERKLPPWRERAALRAWGTIARHPGLYAVVAALGARVLAWLGGGRKVIHNLPFAAGWMRGRDLPAPPGKTFRELYRQRKAP